MGVGREPSLAKAPLSVAMSHSLSPYAGERVALGTMHAKEQAMAQPFERILGAEVVVPAGIDTDAFGTFTGEIERKGAMIDAARAKARLAMQKSGLPFGVGSEGSYGSHPYLPFIPGGTELALFIDGKRSIEVQESGVASRTNYSSHVCSPRDDIGPILSRMRFPTHAVTVRPNRSHERQAVVWSPLPRRQKRPRSLLFKGLTSRDDIVNAIRLCAQSSIDGNALIVPDMRAHLNPTRMAMIRWVALKLTLRIASLCPHCRSPGFGIADVERGLPCADCGAPTQLAVAEIHRCIACYYESRKALRDYEVFMQS